jgi:crotonobetainyl-CoA:carnitine CoA-transferase CaiB-like acyl-CoA transferase
MPGALDGIRVLEVAPGVPGPYAGKLLAGLGADVVKVEPPDGDPARREGPFPGDLPDPERSGLFLHLSTGKASVALPYGPGLRDALGPWLAGADVLLFGVHPEDRAKLGFDTEELRASFPGLVVTSVAPFGAAGPYAEYRGSELIVYALSGYMSLTGEAEREPIKAYGSLVEYQAGAHAALGTMAALLARERDGRGQVVDVSAMEAGTLLLGGVEQNAHFHGVVARRNGTRLLGFPPQHSYPSTIRPCADGYVHAHSNNRHLDLLAALIPHPRLSDPEVLHAMLGHADEVDAIMDPWLASRGRREIVAEAQLLRLPFTEVMTPGEVLEDEHHRARGSFVTVNHPGAGPLLQPGAPIRMSQTPWVTRPAPVLGSSTSSPWPRRSPVVSEADFRRPLAGVRVVDFTNAVAGPIASSLLGHLGAEVIKVEPPNGRPRRAAGTAPLLEGGEDRPWDRVLLFNAFNHGKRSVCLDVTQPAGREVFLRLVAQSDVVVQNFAPRVTGNLGLSYEALRERRADVIMVSMPAFGLDGPYRDRISYGPGIDAMSGLSHLTGHADGTPLKPGNFFCDQNAAVHAAFATLAALRHRAQTGEGQHIELAMIEGEFQVLADAYLDFVMNGRERMRMGNRHERFAPHGVYACAGDDAWVAIACEDDAQWRAFCSVMNEPALAADPRFASAAARKANEEALDAYVAAWTASRDHYAVQRALQAAGVPAAAVLDAGELLRDPHVLARHGFEYPFTPNAGPTPYPRPAFTLSGTPVPLETPAPGFAADNDYVFGQLLGMSSNEIAQLVAERVTAREPTGSAGH